jgi:conflict system pore-forming effector with SLATT domain
MDYDQLIQEAREIIGQGERDDYIIAPTTHAAQFAGHAPALARILRGAALSVSAKQYEKQDAEAAQAQTVFKNRANQANLMVLLTACFSAVLLMVAPLVAGAPGWVSKGLPIALGVCGILTGAAGSTLLFMIRQGSLFERWMKARAGAETQRTHYFELATAPNNDDPNSPIPLPLLQLEYFRRYQLDVQIAFYERRSREFQQAADRLLLLSAIAVGLASVATGIAGLLSGALDARWASVAGVTVIATALSSFAAAKEALSQYRRNRERYVATGEVLNHLCEKLDDVRTAAAHGEREPLETFVASVQQQLSLEHRQWLEIAESIPAALKDLEDALEKFKAKSQKPDAGAGGPAKGAGG